MQHESLIAQQQDQLMQQLDKMMQLRNQHAAEISHQRVEGNICVCSLLGRRSSSSF